MALVPRTLVILSLFIGREMTMATASIPAPAQRFRQDIAHCRSINPVNDDTLYNLNQHGALLDENDEIATCFVACMMKRADLVDEHGEFDVAKARRAIPERVTRMTEGTGSKPNAGFIEQTIQECATISTGDGSRCVKNYKIWTCLYNKLRINP